MSKDTQKTEHLRSRFEIKDISRAEKKNILEAFKDG